MPDRKIKNSSKAHPKKTGNQKQRLRAINTGKNKNGRQDRQPQQANIREGQRRALHAEEKPAVPYKEK